MRAVLTVDMEGERAALWVGGRKPGAVLLLIDSNGNRVGELRIED